MAQKVWDGDRGKFAAVALCFDVGSSSFSGSYSSFFPSRRRQSTACCFISTKIVDGTIIRSSRGRTGALATVFPSAAASAERNVGPHPRNRGMRSMERRMRARRSSLYFDFLIKRGRALIIIAKRIFFWKDGVGISRLNEFLWRRTAGM